MDDQRIGFHHYLRGIVLGAMALFLFRMTLYGDLKYYLAPKLMIYTHISIVALALLSLVHFVLPPEHHHESCDSCTHHHALPKKGLPTLIFFSLFFLPIATGFAFPHHTLGEDAAANRMMNKNLAKQAQGASSAPAGAQRTPISQQQFDGLKKKLLRQRQITVDDTYYTYILNLLNQDPEIFKGKPLVLKGFVYRGKQTAPGEIMTARFGISCCIADASVYGLLTRGAVSELKKDSWIRVSGILDVTKHAGVPVPVLTRSKIQKIKEPRHPYVYDNGILLD
ncbi:TIGR03943 family putative permease subunit [Sporolactobacillus terrae]|uniref:Permease n=1 Tax=Sporolactobacillus terrae TaxID=269673 RepID=A0A5K7X0T2_9BACL|nr:TIGR03943 family protein [Sporolactobacillus terrae]BBN99574.1 permease [Sporolactobacillus terrae]